MSLHLIEFGDLYDDLAAYDLSLLYWNEGDREQAIALMALLVDHIQKRGCDASRRLLLERAEMQLAAMRKCVADDYAKSRLLHRTMERTDYTPRYASRLICNAIYYAVIGALCIFLFGEPPQLTLGI